MNTFDIVSDLHIDQWDIRIPAKYPCGPIKHYPLRWEEKERSRFLIVAGDISDDLDKSIEYLNYLTKFYEKVLFVDGNHEHVNIYPKLYTTREMFEKITNKNIIFLPWRDFILEDTVIIGYCGWWDYEKIEENNSYFQEWIPHFTKEDNIYFANEVSKRARSEFLKLMGKLETYQEDKEIKNIIIVTHTVPDEYFSIIDKETIMNTKFKLFRKNRYDKLKQWIFGHIHSENEKDIDGITMISNPRGRPEDYNRIDYQIKKISI